MSLYDQYQEDKKKREQGQKTDTSSNTSLFDTYQADRQKANSGTPSQVAAADQKQSFVQRAIGAVKDTVSGLLGRNNATTKNDVNIQNVDTSNTDVTKITSQDSSVTKVVQDQPVQQDVMTPVIPNLMDKFWGNAKKALSQNPVQAEINTAKGLAETSVGVLKGIFTAANTASSKASGDVYNPETKQWEKKNPADIPDYQPTNFGEQLGVLGFKLMTGIVEGNGGINDAISGGMSELGTVISSSQKLGALQETVAKFTGKKIARVLNTFSENPLTFEDLNAITQGTASPEKIKAFQSAKDSGLLDDIIKAHRASGGKETEDVFSFLKGAINKFKQAVADLKPADDAQKLLDSGTKVAERAITNDLVPPEIVFKPAELAVHVTQTDLSGTKLGMEMIEKAAELTPKGEAIQIFPAKEVGINTFKNPTPTGVIVGYDIVPDMTVQGDTTSAPAISENANSVTPTSEVQVKNELTPNTTTPQNQPEVVNKTTDVTKVGEMKKAEIDNIKKEFPDSTNNPLYKDMREAQTAFVDRAKELSGKYKTDFEIPVNEKKQLDTLQADWLEKANKWEQIYVNKSAQVVDNAKVDVNKLLFEEAKKYKTVEEFRQAVKGGKTQYGEYNPKLRETVPSGYKKLTELNVDPDEIVTIYRGIDDVSGKVKRSINDGDFVTTDFDSALSYTGDPKDVVEMQVPAKYLYNSEPKDFIDEPFYTGAEYIYTTKNTEPLPSDDELIKIYNEAQKPSKPTQKPSNLPKPAQKTVKVAANPLTPIGTGQTKTPKLALGVEAKAIAKKLTDTFGDLPEYKQVKKKAQGRRADKLVKTDYERAKRIALGQEEPPKTLLPESVYIAVENKAIEDGSVDLLRQLAASSRTREATAMGQRISMLAERNPDSPVAAIQQIMKDRAAAIEAKTGKTVKEAIKSEVEKIQKKVVIPDKNDWNSFLDSIECL